MTCSTQPPGLRIARKPHQADERRRDDLRLRHVLAGQGDVEQVAAAVEEPFAGGVQRGLDVLDVIALMRSPNGRERPRGFAGQHDRAGLRIDGGHPRDGILPGEIGHDHRVVQLVLRHGCQRGDVLGIGPEGPVGHRPGLAGGRIDRRLDLAADVVVELVRLSGAGGAAAVDVQVLEVPLAGLDLRQMDLPCSVLGRERSRGSSARRSRPAARRGGLIDDRGVGRAAVLRLEDQRLRGADRFRRPRGPQPAR